MNGFLLLLVLLFGPAATSRISFQHAKALNAAPPPSPDQGDWVFGLRVVNFLSVRVPGATVIVEASPSKKRQCTTNEHGLICIKMPAEADKVKWTVTAEKFQTKIDSNTRSRYCKGNVKCIMQAVLQGPRLGGVPSSRSSQE